MTCIIGLVEPVYGEQGLDVVRTRVYMGADSVGADTSWNREVRLDQKIFLRDGYLIGFTSSFRMGQVLQYATTLPTPPEPFDRKGERLDWLMEFMVVEFVEAIRKAFKDAGFMKISDTREEGGVFLVGVCGRLFTISSDFQVGEREAKFDAVGCGRQYALGAMAASESDHPEPRLRFALGVAERFNIGVGGPFHVLSLP